jgi:hypothetical protein
LDNIYWLHILASGRLEMFAELKDALARAVADLLHHYDCGLLRLPQVRRYLPKSEASDSYADDATIDRLCGAIRDIGEKLFDLGGLDAMRAAMSDFDWRARSAVEKLWDGIGGAWFA